MTASDNNKRIWEIDAARGIGILCVVVMHAFVFLTDFSSLPIDWSDWSPVAFFIKQYGGQFFVFLSGLSVYFGSKSIKRGGIVFLCGCVLTALSYWLYFSGRESDIVLIQWGVLHLIGFCMIIYPQLKKLPWKLMLVSALAIIIIGYAVMPDILTDCKLLFPIGIRFYWFRAWDYFPIMPGLGWFMLGNVFARLVYKNRESRLRGWNSSNPIIKFFRLCGRNSLQIYMAHMIGFYIIAHKI